MKVSETRAIKLLKKYAPNEKIFKKILKHSKAVQKLALKIAKNIPDIDLDFISIASLLHDIGRFECPPWKNSVKHGIVGAKILKKDGLTRYAKVAERHLGAGITKKEAKKLGLPLKNYVPRTKEEKIIAHADNLVFGNKIGTLKMAVERFSRELGEGYAKRVKRLSDEIESWKK